MEDHMKTLLPAVCLIAASFGLMAADHPPAAWTSGAHYATSTFEIRSQGSVYFSVSVDGRYYPNPVKHFSLANVTPGLHRIELFADAKPHGNRPVPQRIYSGDIYIEPGALVTGVVDNFGRFYIKSVKSLPAYMPPVYEPYPPYTPAPAPRPFPMSSQSFRQLLDVMDDQWFESGKMQVAQQALATNYFTTDQVIDMMETFSFEESRLDLATAAYARVVDPERYFLVNDVFWFSSSVDALSRFIAGR